VARGRRAGGGEKKYGKRWDEMWFRYVVTKRGEIGWAYCSARGADGGSTAGQVVLCVSISCLFGVVCRIIIGNS
jgi:hypothetical protein